MPDTTLKPAPKPRPLPKVPPPPVKPTGARPVVPIHKNPPVPKPKVQTLEMTDDKTGEVYEIDYTDAPPSDAQLSQLIEQMRPAPAKSIPTDEPEQTIETIGGKPWADMTDAERARVTFPKRVEGYQPTTPAPDEADAAPKPAGPIDVAAQATPVPAENYGDGTGSGPLNQLYATARAIWEDLTRTRSAEDEAAEQARQRPAFSYPEIAAAGVVGSSVKNFAQGATAPGLKRNQPREPVDGGTMAQAGQVLKDVFTDIPGNVKAGAIAASQNDGAEQIGALVPELAPNTPAGFAYNALTAAGSDPLNFVGAGAAGKVGKGRGLAALLRAKGKPAPVVEVPPSAAAPVSAAPAPLPAPMPKPAAPLPVKQAPPIPPMPPRLPVKPLTALEAHTADVQKRVPGFKPKSPFEMEPDQALGTSARDAPPTIQDEPKVSDAEQAAFRDFVNGEYRRERGFAPPLPGDVPFAQRPSARGVVKTIVRNAEDLPQSGPVRVVPAPLPKLATAKTVPLAPAVKVNTFRPPSSFATSKAGTVARTVGKNALRAYDEVQGVARAVKYGGDVSHLLRQGLWLSSTRPAAAGAMWKNTFKALASPKFAEKAAADLASHPQRGEMDHFGLFRAGANGAEEETFRGTLTAKLPVLKQFSDMSERTFNTGLNTLRARVWEDTTRGWKVAKITPDSHPEQYEALARYINTATGRGELGALEKHAGNLARVMAAPRLTKSQLDRVNPYWVMKQPNAIKKMWARDMAGTVGSQVALLGLASSAGMKVELNTDSTNFGKVRITKDTWVDLDPAGTKPWLRLAVRLFTAKKNGKPLDPVQGRLGLLEDFARTKLAPLPGVAADAHAGETIDGKPFTLETAAKGQLPLTVQTYLNALEKETPGLAAALATWDSAGGGSTTYSNKHRSSRPKAQPVDPDADNYGSKPRRARRHNAGEEE